MTSVSSLVSAWRQRVADLRRYGAIPNAATLEAAADELEAALREQAEEPLTLPEASCASGYSADHLGREIREGRLQNVGRKGAPRIRRADLPCKPAARLAGGGLNTYDPAADARSLSAGRLQSTGGAHGG